jgi:cellulose synthase/poly-beta-1,6-N-acetylglucosamine synthase-like glycosyltransferase
MGTMSHHVAGMCGCKCTVAIFVLFLYNIVLMIEWIHGLSGFQSESEAIDYMSIMGRLIQILSKAVGSNADKIGMQSDLDP